MRSKITKMCLASPSFFAAVKYIVCLSSLTVALVVILPFQCLGMELRTNYGTIIYDRTDQLLKFNARISFRGSPYRLSNAMTATIDNEVRNKVDRIVKKVQVILDAFPDTLKFNVKLLDEDADVLANYVHRYGNTAHFIAFYSPQNNTIYISVENVSLRILAHEIAHVIIDQYFCTYRSCTPVPVAVQEDLARFVEYKIGN